MADPCIWTGASGKQYTYFSHAMPVRFKPDVDGNYIFTKLVNYTWVPIYIGEGNLAQRCTGQHHQAQCVAAKGATYIHEHVNMIATDRKAEESDLLANYPQAYVPTGCNEKTGG